MMNTTKLQTNKLFNFLSGLHTTTDTFLINIQIINKRIIKCVLIRHFRVAISVVVYSGRTVATLKCSRINNVPHVVCGSVFFFIVKGIKFSICVSDTVIFSVFVVWHIQEAHSITYTYVELL